MDSNPVGKLLLVLPVRDLLGGLGVLLMLCPLQEANSWEVFDGIPIHVCTHPSSILQMQTSRHIDKLCWARIV